MNLDGLFHRSVYVILDMVFAVKNIDRKGSPLYVENRNISEKIRKLFSVHCCRGDY